MNLKKTRPINQKSKTGILIVLFAYGILLFPQKAICQEKLILKPIDLVDLAVKNSKSRKISQAQTLAAKARLAQSYDKALPFVGVSASYYRFTQPDISIGSGLSNLLKGNNSSTNANNVSGSSSVGAPGFPSVNQATLLQGTVSENLFSGFKNKFTIQSDEYLFKASEIRNTGSQNDAVLNALSAYYNIYKLMTAAYLLNQDLLEQNRRVLDFQNLEKNGLITRNDLLKAQLGAGNIKLNISEVDNSLEISKYNFKLMLGIPESSFIEIDTLSLFKERSLKSREEFLQSSMELRTDLLSNAEENHSYLAKVNSSKSGYYPSISLSGGYLDAFVPGIITLKNVINANIGLKYNFTSLFTTHHQTDEAKANLGVSKATYELAVDRAKMEINQNYLNYFESLKKIDLDSEIIAQTEENYKILKNKYANSLSTLTDLLDGELSLLQARLNQANAKADTQIAYYNLIKSSGATLSKDQIK